MLVRRDREGGIASASGGERWIGRIVQDSATRRRSQRAALTPSALSAGSPAGGPELEDELFAIVAAAAFQRFVGGTRTPLHRGGGPNSVGGGGGKLLRFKDDCRPRGLPHSRSCATDAAARPAATPGSASVPASCAVDQATGVASVRAAYTVERVGSRASSASGSRGVGARGVAVGGVYGGDAPTRSRLGPAISPSSAVTALQLLRRHQGRRLAAFPNRPSTLLSATGAAITAPPPIATALAYSQRFGRCLTCPACQPTYSRGSRFE